jgi:hypothetical protein
LVLCFSIFYIQSLFCFSECIKVEIHYARNKDEIDAIKKAKTPLSDSASEPSFSAATASTSESSSSASASSSSYNSASPSTPSMSACAVEDETTRAEHIVVFVTERLTQPSITHRKKDSDNSDAQKDTSTFG